MTSLHYRVYHGYLLNDRYKIASVADLLDAMRRNLCGRAMFDYVHGNESKIARDIDAMIAARSMRRGPF